jgi:hypothetical protein
MPVPARVNLSSASFFPARVCTDLDPPLNACLIDWEGLCEVREPALIGAARDEGFIVTGRIPIRRIEAARGQEFVLSMKSARESRRSCW